VNKKTTQYLKIVILVCLSVYGIIVLYNVVTKEKQRDFKTFYYAAKAYSNGDNPYDMDALSRASGENIKLPFVYPSITLHLFRPFVWFDYHTSSFIFFGLKLVALALLIFLWRKFFLPDASYAMALFLLCILSYRETIIRDLYAGNISCFEQLLLWSAVLCFLKKESALFCFLIVGSALFKVTSIVFLLLPLLNKDRKSLFAMIGALILFLSMHLVSYAKTPTLFMGFLWNVLSLDERGNINPSSLALIKDAVAAFLGTVSWNIAFLDLALYGAFVVFLLVVTYNMVKGFDLQKNRMEFIVICFFLYALTVPRFKDYSYMLLIIPSLYVIRNAMQSNLARAIAVFFICVTFLPYQAFFVTIALFSLYLRYIQRSP